MENHAWNKLNLLGSELEILLLHNEGHCSWTSREFVVILQSFQGLSMNRSYNSKLVFHWVREDLKWPIPPFFLAICCKCWLFCQAFWALCSAYNICSLWWTVVRAVSVGNETSCLLKKRVESETVFALLWGRLSKC